MNKPAAPSSSPRILVTGGSGFIGTNVIAAFERAGWDVANLDVAAPRDPRQNRRWRRVDIMDRASLRRAFDDLQPAAVVHLAARTDLRGADVRDYAVNYEGVAAVIEAISSTKSVARTLFISTRLVFDLGYVPRHDQDYHASSPYGQSKAIAEKIIRETPPVNGTWTIGRPTGIWGPWFGTYREFFESIRKGLYFHPGDRDVLKTFGFVGNATHQIEKIIGAPPADVHTKTFWLADYQPLLVRDWANCIQEALGARRIVSVPVSVLRLAARLGDGLDAAGIRSFPLTSTRLANMTTDMVYRDDALAAITGPLPFSMRQGVAVTAEWLRSEARSTTSVAPES